MEVALVYGGEILDCPFATSIIQALKFFHPFTGFVYLISTAVQECGTGKITRVGGLL